MKNKIIGFCIGVIFYSFAAHIMDMSIIDELLVIILIITGSILQNEFYRSD